MFNAITPEQAGISSRSVERFVRKLEQRGLYNHGLLLMRGDDIFCECYWDPWNKDSIHRMYSQTKSLVGIAIGLLAEEGKLTLDDRIADHFPEKHNGNLDPRLASLKIRDMLIMETAGPPITWFKDPSAIDRTEYYFRAAELVKDPGMLWSYDSAGSQVLSSLVEKLSDMSLLNYLKTKLFDHMGTFRTAKMLMTRNDDTFGDSAMICTLRDMASFGRLLMKGGNWNGKQLINADYVKEATSRIVDNNLVGFNDNLSAFGYGYQIWKTPYNGFAFVGMGQQLTIAIPEKNFLFSYISDNQGFPSARTRILAALEDFILDELSDSPLEADPVAYDSLTNYLSSLKLKHIEGATCAAFAEKLNGATYICEENATGITEFTFHFKDDHTGVFCYKNAQGSKELEFGLGKNTFCKFPQYGYSNEHAGLATTDGFLYDCAASAAWCEDQKLLLRVQIIDEYLGNIYAVFSFREDRAMVNFVSYAEYFLQEYIGLFAAQRLS